MHKQAREWVRQQVAQRGPFYRVVEIGSRDINGGVRDLFGEAAYIGIDCLPGPGVDYLADGAGYHPVDLPDCIVCCEVLEHAEFARDIALNCCQQLPAGGVLILTCATVGRDPHSALDLDPIRPEEWYANIPEDTLLAWLKEGGMSFISTVTPPGYTDLYAVAVK